MSKKPKLEKGKTQSLQSLTIDSGAKVVREVVKDEGVLGQAMRFIESPLGQRVIDLAFNYLSRQIMNIGNPDIRKVQPLATGGAEGAVIARSSSHEHLYKILNKFDEAQIAQILPMIERFSSPEGMKEILDIVLNPEKLQDMLKDIVQGK